MAGFIVGDALGGIKALRFVRSPGAEEPKSDIITLLDATTLGKGRGIQAITSASAEGVEKGDLLAAARADGSVCLYAPQVDEDNNISLSTVHQWSEPRFKPESTFVGFASRNAAIYSCTSNGALTLAAIPPSTQGDLNLPTFKHAKLPMRLCAWRLSPSGQQFAYAGDEVELSIWDTDRAFTESLVAPTPLTAGTKRKRTDALLPAEIWRAKNVANDSLSLRVPVHNTSLAFLDAGAQEGPNHHLLAGTHMGHVRRYDTRVARKPVADWRDIVKAGGVKNVEAGFQEYEAFVADTRSNLSAIDLRNGRILYSYKGISAAITSHTMPITSRPHLIASASNDRYVRLHSTAAPPTIAGHRQDTKGQVLAKVYVGAIPTAIMWDGQEILWNLPNEEVKAVDDNDEEEVWEGMENVSDDDESGKESENTKRGGKRSKK